jgi:hypothetical protein
MNCVTKTPQVAIYTQEPATDLISSKEFCQNCFTVHTDKQAASINKGQVDATSKFGSHGSVELCTALKERSSLLRDFNEDFSNLISIKSSEKTPQ